MGDQSAPPTPNAPPAPDLSSLYGDSGKLVAAPPTTPAAILATPSLVDKTGAAVKSGATKVASYINNMTSPATTKAATQAEQNHETQLAGEQEYSDWLYKNNPDEYRQANPSDYLIRKTHDFISDAATAPATRGMTAAQREKFEPQLRAVTEGGLGIYNVPSGGAGVGKTEGIQTGSVIPDEAGLESLEGKKVGQTAPDAGIQKTSPNAEVTGNQVANHAAQIGGIDDPFQRRAIEKNPAYERKQVNVSDIRGVKGNEQQEKAKQFITKPTPFPPVVLDANMTPIDGSNRIGAAKLRGDATIDAYVPKQTSPNVEIRKTGPDWDRVHSAYVDGKKVGSVGYKVDASGRAQIYGSQVDPKLRGQGIGQKLYGSVIDEAPTKGAKKLTSDSTNTTADANRVWQKIGEKGKAPVEEITHPNGKPGYQIDFQKQTPPDQKSIVPEKSQGSEKELFKNGGWALPNGENYIHTFVDGRKESHGVSAKVMGFDPRSGSAAETDALNQGAVRVTTDNKDETMVVSRGITNTNKSRILDVLSAAPEKPVTLYTETPHFKNNEPIKFSNSEEAIDWVDRQTPTSSKATTDPLDQLHGDTGKTVSTSTDTTAKSANAYHPDLQKVADRYGVSEDASGMKGGGGAGQASFITPDGKFIHLPAGVEHPDATRRAGVSASEDSRVSFLNDTGAVRTRFSVGRAGPTMHISVPKDGVTAEQIPAVRQAIAQAGRNGNVVMERADVSAENKDTATMSKEFPRAADTEDYLRQIQAHPDQRTPARNPNAPEVSEGANAFNAEHGRPDIDTSLKKVSEPFAKELADHFEELQHDPTNPEVQKTYKALKSDIDDQWNYATQKMGMKFEPWDKEGQPYANSREMVEDVKNNHHLYFYQGGDMPADHPMAETDAKTGLTYNDKLRAVHDLFDHAAEGHQFGPTGEENAYQVHRQMFSPEAVPALTGETRAQNSWVNYGPHLRGESGEMVGKGEPGYVAPKDRPFAEQKAVMLDPRFTEAEPELAKTEWIPPKGIEKGIPSTAPVDTKIPLEKISVSPKAYGAASSDIAAGRGSRTSEPVRIFHNPDNGQYLVEDGMHRLVEAHQKGETSVPAKLWSGYSDSIANVHGEKMDLSPMDRENDWHEAAGDAAAKNEAGGIDPRTGKSDTKGFGVEVMPELRQALDHAPTAEDFKKFYDQHRDVFDKHPELRVGWDNNSAVPGGHEINVGAVGDDAARVAKKLDQKSVFNIEKGEIVPTGGSGLRTDFPNYPLEDRMRDLKGENPSDIKNFEHLSKDVYDHLEPDERDYLKGNKTLQRNVMAQYHKIAPSVNETTNAMQAGAALGGWWKRYIDVFQNIAGDGEGVAKTIGPSHAEALKQWHAAVSGNKSVEDANNLAWHSYADWLDAGKPTDRKSINDIIKKNAAQPEGSEKKGNAAISDTLDKKGRVISPGLDTNKLYNLVNSPEMKGERPFGGDVFREDTKNPLMGPTVGARKIPSMGATVAGKGNLNRLVIDAHIRDFYGYKNSGGPAAQYIADSAHLRQAAEALGLKGGEGQEQLWGTVLGLKTLLKEGLTPEEAGKKLNADVINKIGKDYAEVIANDPEITRPGGVLDRLKERYGIGRGSAGISGANRQASGSDASEGGPNGSEKTTDTSQLAKTAERIRGQISESKIKKPATEGPDDTSFNFGANVAPTPPKKKSGKFNALDLIRGLDALKKPAPKSTLDTFLNQAAAKNDLQVLPKGKGNPTGMNAHFLMADGRWLTGYPLDRVDAEGDELTGHPALADAAGGEKKLLETGPVVRVVGPREFDFIGAPQRAQIEEVARVSKGQTHLVWDMRDNSGRRLMSGEGSLGELQRALDKQYPAKK